MTDNRDIMALSASMQKAIEEHKQAANNKKEIEKNMDRFIDEEHSIDDVRQFIHEADQRIQKEEKGEMSMRSAICKFQSAMFTHIATGVQTESPKQPEQWAICKAALSEQNFTLARNAYARSKREYEVKKATQLILSLKQPKEGNTHVQFPQRDRKVPIIVRLVCIDIYDEKQGIITLDDCPIARTFQFTKQIERARAGVQEKEEGIVYESLCTRLAGKLAVALYDRWMPYEIDAIQQSLKKHCTADHSGDRDKMEKEKFIIGLKSFNEQEYVLLIYSTQDKVHQMQPQANAHKRIESTAKISGENKFNMWLHVNMLKPVFQDKHTLTKTTNAPHGEESIWRSYTAKALSAIGI